MALNIVFDLDGTLFKTETVDIDAFNHALQDAGHETKGASYILDLIGEPLDKISMSLLKTKNRTVMGAFNNGVIKYELELIPKNGELYDGVADTLRCLKAQGHKLFICSNGSPEYVTAIIEKFGLRSYFEKIWFKHYGFSKARGLKRITKKYEQNKTILIGDRFADQKTAQEADCLFIWAKYGYGFNDDISCFCEVTALQQLIPIIKAIEAGFANG